MKKRELVRFMAAMMTSVVLVGSLTGCGAKNETAYVADANPTEEAACTEECDEPYVDYSRASNTMKGYEAESYGDVEAEEVYTGYECDYDEAYIDNSGERYESNVENGFSLVANEPLSTFSADVDTASYANARRMVEEGYGLDAIDADAIRAEEFINYFSYDLQKPTDGDKFGITTQLAKCPWNEKNEIMMVGMSTKDIDLSKRPSSNFVFLLDVSGSMNSDDKLPLLQKSFAQLVDNLNKHDRVSIVTYASGVDVVLANARGDEKELIKTAIDSLYAGGGTNGEGGIQLAYELAESNFIKNGNNRVILATDGDLNIGISEPQELENLITKKKESGVYLSVLGFGTGNIRDDNMERLADKGNGNYAYIDSLFEAKKVLVEEMGATLNTVAKDVKLQVEFNPAKVNSYRLIGYENRMMAAQDFYDDTKDAGEIGAGHQVVALYEIVPAGANSDIELKYGSNDKQETCETENAYSDEYATVKVAYKQPNSDKSEMESKIVNVRDFVSEKEKNIHFAAMVAQYAMILSDSPYKGTATLDGILEQYQEIKDHSEFWDEYKEEFFYLVKTMCKRQ